MKPPPTRRSGDTGEHMSDSSPPFANHDHSLLLLFGAVPGFVWANLAHGRYERLAHALHFTVNDIGMAFFFALAAKEVVEATKPGGALHSPRRVAVPLTAALGGSANGDFSSVVQNRNCGLFAPQGLEILRHRQDG